MSASAMDPGHNAILLSQSESSERRDSPSGATLPPPTSNSRPTTAGSNSRVQHPSLTDVARDIEARLARPDSPSGGDITRAAGTSTQPLRFGPRTELSQGTQSRRSVVEAYVRMRRYLNQNDPSTTLGHRVAARVATGSQQAESSSDLSSEVSIAEEMSSRFLQLASNLHRDLQAEHQALREAIEARHQVNADSATNQTTSSSTTADGSRDQDSSMQNDRSRLNAQWRLARLVRDNRPRASLTSGRRTPTLEQNSSQNGSASRAQDRTVQPAPGTSSSPPSTSHGGSTARDSGSTRHRMRRRLSEADRTLHVSVMDDSSENDDPFSWYWPRSTTRVRGPPPLLPQRAPDSATPSQNVPSDSTADEWGRDTISSRLQQMRDARVTSSTGNPRRRRRGWGMHTFNRTSITCTNILILFVLLQHDLIRMEMRYPPMRKRNTNATAHKCGLAR